MLLHQVDSDPMFYEEDEGDDDEDLNDILLKLGMKGELEAKPTVEDEDKPILTKLLLAIALSKRSQEMLRKSAQLMEEVVVKCPNLKKLSDIFNVAKDFSPESIAEARLKTKFPQCFSASRNPKYAPISIEKGKHACRQCSFVAKTWSGADSHIRQVHSRIFYGPCPSCSFKTSNQDVFRRHLISCQKQTTLNQLEMNGNQKENSVENNHVENK